MMNLRKLGWGDSGLDEESDDEGNEKWESKGTQEKPTVVGPPFRAIDSKKVRKDARQAQEMGRQRAWKMWWVLAMARGEMVVQRHNLAK